MKQTRQRGKFGTNRHFELVKKALVYAIDRYWETFGTIIVESAKISMHACVHASHIGLHDFSNPIDAGHYDLHPDIVIQLRESEKSANSGVDCGKKAIIIECETTDNNLLKDELRLTAYKLLRMRTPDRSKLMMYIALPLEFEGRVEKPECFNDLLFFNMEGG